MLFDMSALAVRRLVWVLAAATLVVTGTFGFLLGGVGGGASGSFVELGIVGLAPIPEVPDYRAVHDKDCDLILKQQLVLRRNVSESYWLNLIIGAVQDQRADLCSLDLWNPIIVDPADGPDGSHCWPYSSSGGRWAGQPPAGGVRSVGGIDVPAGLIDGRVGDVRVNSGRDGENNIIVYFSDPEGLPGNGASCWLFVFQLSRWSHQ